MVGEKESGDLTAIADDVVESAESETMTLGDLLDQIESRGFGPLILVPAAISASPAGAIPGMSIATGSIIFLIAFQMLFRSGHPWMPKFIETFSFSKNSFERSIKKIRPWIKWLDKLTRERLTMLVDGPMYYVLAVMIMLLSVSYYPLALVPGGVFLPAMATCIFAIGITTRDGIMIIIGLFGSAGSMAILYSFWPL